MEVVFLHFEVWVADLQGFDVRFESGMSNSPMGLILSRIRCNGADFLRVKIKKNNNNRFSGLKRLPGFQRVQIFC